MVVFIDAISASELLVDHVRGVEHDSTIRLMVGARLGTLNGRVECQIVVNYGWIGQPLHRGRHAVLGSQRTQGGDE